MLVHLPVIERGDLFRGRGVGRNKCKEIDLVVILQLCHTEVIVLRERLNTLVYPDVMHFTTRERDNSVALLLHRATPHLVSCMHQECPDPEHGLSALGILVQIPVAVHFVITYLSIAIVCLLINALKINIYLISIAV